MLMATNGPVRRLSLIHISRRHHHARRHRWRRESVVAPRQIFKFPHIARPAMFLQAVEGCLVDLLRRQSFALDHGEEMPDQIGDVFGALPQRRQPQRHHIEAEEQVFAEQRCV